MTPALHGRMEEGPLVRPLGADKPLGDLSDPSNWPTAKPPARPPESVEPGVIVFTMAALLVVFMLGVAAGAGMGLVMGWEWWGGAR